LTKDQGETDGEDAVNKMALQGFELGTYVFLDVEGYSKKAEEKAEQADPANPLDIMAYIRAWVSKVAGFKSTAAGATGKSYAPGIYCHSKNVDDISPEVDAALTGTGITARYWITGGPDDFSVDSDPTTAWGSAMAWQNPHFGIKEKHVVQIEIDQSVSDRDDPAGP
jgi:hypothetical protein